MKFSVAVRMRLPDAPAGGPAAPEVLLPDGPVCDACSTVAGSPIRSRSVARGHSSYWKDKVISIINLNIAKK